LYGRAGNKKQDRKGISGVGIRGRIKTNEYVRGNEDVEE